MFLDDRGRGTPLDRFRIHSQWATAFDVCRNLINVNSTIEIDGTHIANDVAIANANARRE